MDSRDRLQRAAKALLRVQSSSTKTASIQPIKACTIDGLSAEAVQAGAASMSMRGTNTIFMISIENGLRVRNKEFKEAMQTAQAKGYKIALINWNF